jgi:hypothetical protein
MADLLAAAQKQITYAGNEFASGDAVKGQEHLDKAAAFIERAAGGESSGVLLANNGEDAPLSTDASTALAQILSATGHPITLNEEGQTVAIDPLNVIADASAEQQRELALLGFFGQPESRDDVDYSLFTEYYHATGDGNWAPNDPDTSAWATYLAGKA